MGMRILTKVLVAAILCAGSSMASAFTLYGTFDNGTVGKQVVDMGGVFQGFTNTLYAASPSPVFAGKQSAQMGVAQGDTAFGKWGAEINFPTNLTEGSELWLRVSTFFPVGFNYTGNPRLKFIRFHTADPATGRTNTGYDDTYILPKGQFSYDNEINGITTSNTPFGNPIKEGVWETYEQYVKFSHIPGQGIYRLWQNGRLIHEDKTLSTLASSTGISDYAYIFSYWNGGSPATQTMYVDDVVITTSQPACLDDQGNHMIGPAHSTAPGCAVAQ